MIVSKPKTKKRVSKKPALGKAVDSLTRLEVRVLYRYLNIPMHGSDAKIRHDALKVLRPLHESIIDGRNEVFASFAEKDEKGKPVVEKGTYKIPPEKHIEATNASVEYLLMDAGCTLPGKTLKKLAYIVDKNNHADMSVDEAEMYYALLEKLEKIK